jgi:hypothetical protein
VVQENRVSDKDQHIIAEGATGWRELALWYRDIDRVVAADCCAKTDAESL